MSGWLVSKLRPAVLVAALLTLPSMAFAEGGSVRFSYEKVEIGDSVEWVMMPRLETALVGKVDEKMLSNAFELLRKDKRGSYGKASIAISGKAPKFKATVTIDPDYAAYSVIVIAETVFTLSELGVEEITFPGFVDGPITRGDIPFAGYSLEVPLHKAMGISSPSIQVRFPDGSLQPSSVVAGKFKSKDADLMASLYSYLQSKDPYTVRTVALALGGMKVPFEAQVAALLQHKNLDVRTTALEVLGASREKKDVLEAVAKHFAAEKDPGLKTKSAEFLGASKDKAFNILLQIHRSDDADEKVAIEAVKALGGYSDARATEVLTAKLQDGRVNVASAAAVALHQAKSTAPLVAALQNAKVDARVRLETAHMLAGEKGEDERLAGLDFVALNDIEHKSVEAVATIARAGEKGRKLLDGYLVSDKGYLRLASLEALVAAKAEASLPAIAAAVKAGKDAAAMEEGAYAIMVAQPLKTIMDRTKDGNVLVKRVAYRAIGERAMKENAGAKVFGIIKDGLGSSDVSVRGASARAMGQFADAKAAEALKPLVKDKSADVRRDVALAIGNFKEAELADELKTMLEDKTPAVQAAAIRSFALRGEAFVWAQIKELAKSPDAGVRAASLFALAKLVSREDAQGVREVISALSGAVSDPDVGVRIEAVQALGTFRDEKAVTGIAIQLNTDDEALRLAAVKALGTTTHPSAADLVESVLADPNRKIRKAAIEALGLLKARKPLEARAQAETDKELQELIRATLKRM